MEVARMQMPKAQAKTMLRDYRRQVSKRATDEYRAIEEGLRWMARGRPVINLSESIQKAGLFESGFPKLAICRADMPGVTVRWGGWSRTAVFTAQRPSGMGRQPKNMTVSVDMGGLHGKTHWEARAGSGGVGANVRTDLSGRTMTPLVPPRALNEAHRGVTGLASLFVLWEVEKWEPIPPVDPMLVHFLGGDLYVVLAEWDLTPLERAVIAGTRR